MHNYCGFFSRLFFSLKIGVLLNFFHKNNLLFSVNENAYRKSYPYSPYYALPLWETLECSTVVSRSQRTFWRWEQSAKVKLKNGSRSSNPAIQTSQMKKEEADHKISTTRHFWQPWKRTKAWQAKCWPKSSMWTFIRPSFVVWKSSEKYRNWPDGFPQIINYMSREKRNSRNHNKNNW